MAEAESIIDYDNLYQDLRESAMSDTSKLNVNDLLSATACNIAIDNNVDLFVCLTETGKIARFLSKCRPIQPILALSTNTNVVRQVNTSKGVIGYKIPSFLSKSYIKYIIMSYYREIQ